MRADLPGRPSGSVSGMSVGVVDDPSELAKVSWPVVGHQGRDRLRREPAPLVATALVGTLQEVLCQNGQLVASLA